MADVAAIVHPFKMNQIHGLVGTGQRLFQRRRGSGYAQHAASSGEDLSFCRPGRASMEDLHSRNPRGGIEAGDGEAGLVLAVVLIYFVMMR